MKNKIQYIPILLLAGLTLVAVSCGKVYDEPQNVHEMTLTADTVCEGDDIPVRVSFSKAGLSVDNPGWGDPLKNAEFDAVVKDSYGHTIENAVWSWSNGIIKPGSLVDIPASGTVNLVLSGLREGEYSISINLKTRYTVDTWATGWVTVLPPAEGGGKDKVLCTWFDVPDKDNGFEVDDDGNIIIDLRFFNASNPLRFTSHVLPADATNKRLQAKSTDESILEVSIEKKMVFVFVPKVVGVCRVNAESVDGGAKRSFGVRVIETEDKAKSFTLPTDGEGGDEDADFDVGGRLALDINDYADGHPYSYTCKPIPATATLPSLKAVSDKPEVADAKIVDGNGLRIYPKSVGYANVTVSWEDGTHARTLRVAVISVGQILMKAVEATPSADDITFGIFPCSLKFEATTTYLPGVIFVDVYAKSIGRADLTDPDDYFLREEIKNARSSFYEFEEETAVAFIPGVSQYDVYTRLMIPVAMQSEKVHHGADWPNYYDYVMRYNLYKIVLRFNIREGFDTNLYRITLVEDYNRPENKIYQYL